MTALAGLSSADAKRILASDGYNELPSDKPRSALKIIVEVITEPMFLLLLGAAAIYLTLGDIREALVLCSSIFIIIIITFVQERRTEQTLARLKDLTSPQALVIRDGVSIRVPGRNVVAGDVLIIREGDRTPADLTLIESTGITTDESILTGESLPVEKSVTTDAHLYSGSMILTGYGTATVTATGIRTQLGKIGKDLQSIKIEASPLYREVHRLVRWVAVGGIALCVVVASALGMTSGRWLNGILAGITVAMGVLPEEFPVVLTVFLAMGAWRIARHHVLTRRIPAIESLGAATVLAVDKTGTLTENRMQLAFIRTSHTTIDLRAQSLQKLSLDDEAKALLGIAMAASERDAFDPMEQAIHESARQHIATVCERYDSMALIREYDLTPELRAVTHVWQSPADTHCTVACKGAPETVMALCRLDQCASQEWMNQVNALATQGLRVLGVANGLCAADELPASPSGFQLNFLGLLCLADPVRSDVPHALQECKQAGIRVVMITGDHAGTASTIAAQAGFRNASAVMNCNDMNDMSDEQLQMKARSVDIYARATPQHKLRLVHALKSNNEIVVMTGDGVNDAPALKAAHVGVAMGKRGTDVAREAAAVVLMNDDFSSLVRGVRLGRRIYDNIQNAMHYLVAVHIPLAGIGLLPALLGWPLVFFPVHVLFLEFVIDPACSFVFEADTESPDVMQRKPRRPDARLFTLPHLKRSLVFGMMNLAVTVSVYYWSLHHLLESQARALCFTTLVLGNIVLMLLVRARNESLSSVLMRRNDAFWIIAVAACLALWAVIFIPGIASMFQFAPPPTRFIAWLIGITLGSLILILVWQRSAKRITLRLH